MGTNDANPTATLTAPDLAMFARPGIPQDLLRQAQIERVRCMLCTAVSPVGRDFPLDADGESVFADELQRLGFVPDTEGFVSGLIVIDDLRAAVTYE